jgi:hypothetical protein
VFGCISSSQHHPGLPVLRHSVKLRVLEKFALTETAGYSAWPALTLFEQNSQGMSLQRKYSTF